MCFFEDNPNHSNYIKKQNLNLTFDFNGSVFNILNMYTFKEGIALDIVEMFDPKIYVDIYKSNKSLIDNYNDVSSSTGNYWSSDGSQPLIDCDEGSYDEGVSDFLDAVLPLELPVESVHIDGFPTKNAGSCSGIYIPEINSDKYYSIKDFTEEYSFLNENISFFYMHLSIGLLEAVDYKFKNFTFFYHYGLQNFTYLNIKKDIDILSNINYIHFNDTIYDLYYNLVIKTETVNKKGISVDLSFIPKLPFSEHAAVIIKSDDNINKCVIVDNSGFKFLLPSKNANYLTVALCGILTDYHENPKRINIL